MTESWVYFIEEVPIKGDLMKRGNIKIGTSFDVEARLRSCQTGNPRDLQVLGVMAGGCEIESVLHRKFKQHRIRGEWFRPAKRLLVFIEKNTKTFCPAIKHKQLLEEVRKTRLIYLRQQSREWGPNASGWKILRELESRLGVDA